jgi:hypothetical protein
MSDEEVNIVARLALLVARCECAEARVNALEHDGKLAAGMLARQCDLAHDAEARAAEVTRVANARAARAEADARAAEEGLDHLLALIGKPDYQEACAEVLALHDARAEIATMRAAHDILGEYPGEHDDGGRIRTDGRREWWSGGTWLYPGECVAVLPLAVVAMQERKP